MTRQYISLTCQLSNLLVCVDVPDLDHLEGTAEEHAVCESKRAHWIIASLDGVNEREIVDVPHLYRAVR